MRWPIRQRDAISRTFRRAPIVAKLDSMHFAFICFALRTCARETIPHRLRVRSDVNYSNWFIALSIEQLALITDNGFHFVPFVKGCYLADGVGIAPTQV